MDNSCNKCGECCKQGGSCIYRKWDNKDKSWEFEGICDNLIFNEDRSTYCQVLAKVDPKVLKQWIFGTCDFPQYKKELLQLEVKHVSSNL